METFNSKAVFIACLYIPNCIKGALINSWLSRCSTARGSDSGLSLGGPTKIKAHKSFLFAEGSLKVEIKNMFDFVVTPRPFEAHDMFMYYKPRLKGGADSSIL